MADPNNDTLAKIQQYAAESKALQDREMDIDSSDMEVRLEHTIKELEGRVQQQQAALEKLRKTTKNPLSTTPSSSSHQKLAQLQILTQTYKSLTPTPPFLPTPPSILPSLLAARTLQSTISGTKSAISSTQTQISTTQQRLQIETQHLTESNLITTSLESRISKLRTNKKARTQQTPAQLAADLITAYKTQKQNSEKQLSSLSKSFDDIRTDILAPLLAAEELSGPIAGTVPIPEETLSHSFTRRGAPRKAELSDPKRQRRIDEIWGSGRTYDDQPLSEVESASEELRELLMGLFETSVETGGVGYLVLTRDSAAVRFLVRCRVAVFHPKDARRVRFVDFGRGVDE